MLTSHVHIDEQFKNNTNRMKEHFHVDIPHNV